MSPFFAIPFRGAVVLCTLLISISHQLPARAEGNPSDLGASGSMKVTNASFEAIIKICSKRLKEDIEIFGEKRGLMKLSIDTEGSSLDPDEWRMLCEQAFLFAGYSSRYTKEGKRALLARESRNELLAFSHEIRLDASRRIILTGKGEKGQDPDGVSIDEVERRMKALRNDFDKAYYRALSGMRGRGKFSPEKVDEAVQRIGAGEKAYTIAREDVADIFESPKSLNAARAVPYYRNGKAEGLRLFAIRRDSALAKLGLVNGDIITKLNQKDDFLLKKPLTIMSLYSRAADSLKEKDFVEVEIERKERDVTLRWELQ